MNTVLKNHRASRPAWHQLIILLLIAFSATSVFSQIVPNGSFENNTCNNNFNCVTSWGSGNVSGSPDYYTRTNGLVPNLAAGNYQETQPSGEEGFVGILTGSSGSFQYHEYLRAQLNTPLTENKCYKVRFYLNWAPSVNNANALSYIKKMGALLSSNAMLPAGYNAIQRTPQLETNFWLNDSSGWTLVEGCIKVPEDSTYNYITIGNFEVNPTQTTPPGVDFRSYYFIDAVSIDSVNSNSGFSHSTPGCGVPVYFSSDEQGGTHSWDFGDGSTSTNVNPDHLYNGGGIFIVKHTVTNNGCDCSSTTYDTIQILNCCMCESCGKDLVRNGNFSKPCHSDYQSELMAKPCPNAYTDPNEYTEDTDASISNGNWCGKDHTGTPGSKFLVLDGQTPGRPVGAQESAKGWYQKVGKIKKGKRYCFVAYVKNICKKCMDKPSLKLQINAGGTNFIVDAVEDLPFNECCDAGWTKMCGSWTAQEDIDSIELSVLITRGQWVGNDAGVDDISFSEADVVPDAAFTDSGTYCANTPVYFKSLQKNGTHNWTFGDGSSSTFVDPIHVYNTPGNYTVQHIITTPCGKDTVTRIINIKDCCCKICITNLVPNGNFSSSVSCFTSYSTDLQYNNCVPVYSYSDSITEHVNAQSVIPSWYGKDHTGTPGSRLLIVDFPYTYAKRGWYTTVPVIPGKTYCYSMYVKNLAMYSSASNSPSFDMRVKGMGGPLIRHVEKLPFDSGWTKICGEWTAGISDYSVELDLVVYPGIGAGFDLGVDDISFGEKCDSSEGGGLPPQMPENNDPDMGSMDNNQALSISPIPVKRGIPLQLLYNSKEDKNISITITDLNGRTIRQLKENTHTGTNTLDIATSEFSPGIYYIRVDSGAEIMTKKVIIAE